MPRFITRVELHQGTYDDYQSLHAAMGKAGFSRQITSDEPKTYHLPTAEYYCEKTLARSEILKLAKAAATSTGRSNGVIVTESSGMTWKGLKEV